MDKLQFPYRPARTIFAIVRNSQGDVWDGAAFTTYTSVDLVDYEIPLAEQSTSGFYLADFPPVPQGVYQIGVYDGANLVGAGNYAWNGSAIIPGIQCLTNLDAIESAFETGIAQAGTLASITLRANAPSDAIFKDQAIMILSGTGAKQTNRITAYNGTTKTAQVETAWTVVPDNTSRYLIVGRIG